MPQDRPDLPVGETVDVKLRSAVVVGNAPLVVQLSGEEVTVPAGGAGVVDIDVVSPANWPPLRGDVWLDVDGTEWFGVEVVEDGQTKIKLIAETGGTPQSYQMVKTNHRPLTLVHRSA